MFFWVCEDFWLFFLIFAKIMRFKGVRVSALGKMAGNEALHDGYVWQTIRYKGRKRELTTVQ